jgi:DNA-binding transcriptional MerR regulator
MRRATYTTKAAAAKVGITRATLQAWIKAKKITPPKPTLEGAKAKRLWTESALNRLRVVKERIYWKGQGRPRRKKQTGRAGVSSTDTPLTE